MIDAAKSTMKRFAKMYGMQYMGISSNHREAQKLNDILK